MHNVHSNKCIYNTQSIKIIRREKKQRKKAEDEEEEYRKNGDAKMIAESM